MHPHRRHVSANISCAPATAPPSRRADDATAIHFVNRTDKPAKFARRRHQGPEGSRHLFRRRPARDRDRGWQGPLHLQATAPTSGAPADDRKSHFNCAMKYPPGVRGWKTPGHLQTQGRRHMIVAQRQRARNSSPLVLPGTLQPRVQATFPTATLTARRGCLTQFGAALETLHPGGAVEPDALGGSRGRISLHAHGRNHRDRGRRRHGHRPRRCLRLESGHAGRPLR